MAYEITAGTVVSYSTDGGTIYKVIKKVDEIGDFGLDGSFIDTTSLEDTTKEYTGGIMDTPDIPTTFKEVVGDADQAEFLSLAESRTDVKMKVEFPSGTFAEFGLALSGYKTSTTDVIKHTVNGKQSGAPIWTRA